MKTILLSLSSVGACLLLLSLLPKNSNFLDVRRIIISHIKVLKANPLQFICIFIIPIIFSITILQFRFIDQNILNNLNIVLSILLSMFFAMLSILSSLNYSNKDEKYLQLQQETFIATVFEIIICLCLLLISFIVLFVGQYGHSIYLIISSFVVYYLTIVCILNILSIIKLLQALFENR